MPAFYGVIGGMMRGVDDPKPGWRAGCPGFLINTSLVVGKPTLCQEVTATYHLLFAEFANPQPDLKGVESRIEIS